uniref:Large ribosomal subunit protein P2 n=1 Tax=Sus scrofa TaxID=9823 RepID=A0A8D1H928_PIG
MRYVASYLLAALGGNTSPSAKDIKKILDSVGIEADDDRLNKVISELNGKNIEDVIAQGIGKLASVPSGGAVAVAAAPGSAAPAAGSAPAAGKWRLRQLRLHVSQGLWWGCGLHHREGLTPWALRPHSRGEERREEGGVGGVRRRHGLRLV